MGDYSAYEGQKFDDGSGNVYTVTNGKFVDQHGKVFDYDPPVTTGQGKVQPFHMPGPYEAAKDVGTQLAVGGAETVEQAGTLPFGVANWTGKGMQAAAPVVGQVAPDTAKSMASAGQTLEQASQPYTFGPQWAKEVQQHPFLGTQPQTEFGALARQVPGAAAGALTAGEGLIPAAARTAGAVGGSEIGQYLTGSPWGQMAGSLLGYGGIPTGPLRGDSTMVRRLMNQGTDVSAAQRTGSGVRSLLEGGPPAGQMKDISDSMLRQAGIVRQAGDDRPITELADDRWTKELQPQVKALEKNTSLPVKSTDRLWYDLGKMDLDYRNARTGASTGVESSTIDPDVHQAYLDFQNYAKGGNELTGEQYSELSRKWGKSDTPALKAMGARLDAEMEKYHPEWTKWNDDYANLQGVRGAIEKSNAPTTQGIDPGVVYKSMYRNTDMRRYADSAREVTSQYPEPKGAGVLNALGTIATTGAGAAAGYHLGGPMGAFAGSEATFLPYILGGGPALVGSGINKLAGSALGQKYLMMNPKAAAAALLGQQAVQPEGQMKK